MGKKPPTTTDSLRRPRKKAVNWYVAVVVTLVAVVLLILFSTSPTKRMTPETRPPQLSAAQTPYEFQKQGELRFLNAKGRLIITVDIEIAREELKRELGLMYREKMAENQAMLFVFDGEGPRSFWMKNTIQSLDMIFVNGKNEVVTIHKYTTPYSEDSYASTRPAQYVVEVNGGFADKYGIAVGDRIAWRVF
jgi:uncharacterized membrane protein (UPF0127 family)